MKITKPMIDRATKYFRDNWPPNYDKFHGSKMRRIITEMIRVAIGEEP